MTYDVAIAGAGIVGLATAWQLKQLEPNLRIAVVEKEPTVARHQTGHNSGVMHSGIYYKPGSLKAENCINGYQLMLDFCREHAIAHEICGKVIVATTEAEHGPLLNILQRGQKNGLQGLQLLDETGIRQLEPQVKAISGIHVLQAGIVSYARVAQKLQQLLAAAGVTFFFNEKVTALNTGAQVEVVTTKNRLTARCLVNCAGLYADKLALMEGPDPGVRMVPFRGEYYTLRNTQLVRNLIYPVPDPAFPFLGLHFTRMIDGGVECGPNAVLAFRREGYTKTDVDFGELGETLAWPGFQKVAARYWQTGMAEMYRSFSKAAFTSALQKLVPAVKSRDLLPGGAGVRAQACDRNGNLLDDFRFHETEHSVHVLNAPSPAATSSLAIGQTIAGKVFGKLE